MKLEHLLQAYKVNNINANLKENINEEEERAGVINFANGISASYLLDDEDIVVAMKIFFNCLVPDENGKLTVTNQVEHTIKIITIIQKTMMLLSNIPQKEANMILEHLGLFDNTFRSGKQIKHLEHEYRIEVVDGLLCFSTNEINN
ncbi:MAG: hypothetical protein J6A89_04085 [Clostridia bacterium]|nr:hypothetical protein [Clostridia bacterium]